MKKIIAATCFASLAGCATIPDGGWAKAGSSDQDFYEARGQCVAQMEGAPYGANKPIILVGCMQGKGWHWEEKR